MPARIPEALINEIIAANDLTEIVSKYVTLKRSGSSMVGLCPFHREKTPSFHVSPDRQLYYCFGCGEGGNVFNFVQKIENLDFHDTIEQLAKNANIKLPSEGLSEQDRQLYEQKQLIYRMNREAALFYREKLLGASGEKAKKYILGRGFTSEMLTAFGMGYSPDAWSELTDYLVSKGFKKEDILLAGLARKNKKGGLYDFFRDRLMFPIIDVHSKITGFSARTLDPNQKGWKYLNTSDTLVFNKGSGVYNLNYAKKYSSGEIILVEGQLDVISLYQFGFKNAVAPLGTAFTESQARLISRYADRVVICYDTDSAGIKATDRAIEIFKGKDTDLRIMTLAEGTDPDEYVRKYGAKAFEKRLKDAKSVPDYKISVLENKFDLTGTNDKIEFANSAAKILAGVSNAVERDVLTRKVSERTGIALSSIEAEIGKDAKRQIRRNKREAALDSVKFFQRRSTDKTARLIDAERTLISLCAADKSLITKFNEILDGDFFTEDIHNKIISILSDTDSAVSDIVMQFDADDTAQAAAALGMPLNFEDTRKAAGELIEVIKKEKREYLIDVAMKENDLETLNRLVMEKNKH